MAHPDHWVFGYGSLIYRPAFPFVERVRGVVRGWSRRFWQASVDHRGTLEHPGRVVTVTPSPDEVLWGMAYRVAPAEVPAVMAKLDHRESGGYERHEVAVEVHPGGAVAAVMYVAGPDNPNFIGEAPLDEMARHVLSSEGKSGHNVDYVLRLAEALREMDVSADPAFELEARIHVMMGLPP